MSDTTTTFGREETAMRERADRIVKFYENNAQIHAQEQFAEIFDYNIKNANEDESVKNQVLDALWTTFVESALLSERQFEAVIEANHGLGDFDECYKKAVDEGDLDTWCRDAILDHFDQEGTYQRGDVEACMYELMIEYDMFPLLDYPLDWPGHAIHALLEAALSG